MSVKVYADDVVASYKIYQYDAEDNIVEYGMSSEVFMHTYDTIFKARNKNNPSLIRITVTSPSLYEKSTSDNSVMTFELTRKIIDGEEGNNSITSKYLTSIMQFGMAVEDPNFDYSSTQGETTATKIYNYAYDNYLHATSNTNKTPIFNDSTYASTNNVLYMDINSFVVNDSKNESITFDVNYNINSWRNNAGRYELNFYILINYDPSRVSSFGSSDLSAGLNGNLTDLKSDLESITIL